MPPPTDKRAAGAAGAADKQAPLMKPHLLQLMEERLAMDQKELDEPMEEEYDPATSERFLQLPAYQELLERMQVDRGIVADIQLLLGHGTFDQERRLWGLPANRRSAFANPSELGRVPPPGLKKTLAEKNEALRRGRKAALDMLVWLHVQTNDSFYPAKYARCKAALEQWAVFQHRVPGWTLVRDYPAFGGLGPFEHAAYFLDAKRLHRDMEIMARKMYMESVLAGLRVPVGGRPTPDQHNFVNLFLGDDPSEAKKLLKEYTLEKTALASAMRDWTSGTSNMTSADPHVNLPATRVPLEVRKLIRDHLDIPPEYRRDAEQRKRLIEDRRERERNAASRRLKAESGRRSSAAPRKKAKVA